MLPPPVHDDAPDPSDRRGSDGAPPYGRRRDDEHAQAILDEVRGLHAEVENMAGEVKRAVQAVQPWTWKRIAAVVGVASLMFTAVSGTLMWFGGGIVGPGARIEDLRAEQAAFRAAQARADTVASLERIQTRQSVDMLAETVAQFGYDVCTGVHKKAPRECFDLYLARENRAAPHR